MKKIFAIVLAVAMVLSMASASAMYCETTPVWNCPTTATKCGKASIEVIEYVRTKTDCGVELAKSDCAVALEGDRINYAIKLTVPSDINETWYKKALDKNLKVDYTNLAAGYAAITTKSQATGYYTLPAWETVKDGGVWFLKVEADMAMGGAEKAVGETNDPGYVAGPTAATWVKESSFDTATCVWTQWVYRGCAKVCATIASESNGLDTTIAGWKVVYTAAKDAVTGTDPQPAAPAKLTFQKAGEKDVVLTMADDTVRTAVIDGVTLNGYDAAAGKFVGYVVGKDSTAANLYGFDCAPGSTLKKVFDFFGLAFGSCVNTDNLKTNFGWNDTFKACSDYKANGTAIVDAACEIDIPKTGDVSVIAYAVMAIVAAAGAMGLKK